MLLMRVIDNYIIDRFHFYIVINHQRYERLGHSDASRNNGEIAVNLGYDPMNLDHLFATRCQVATQSHSISCKQRAQLRAI